MRRPRRISPAAHAMIHPPVARLNKPRPTHKPARILTRASSNDRRKPRHRLMHRPMPRPTRTVALIVNCKVAATKEVPADDTPHEIAFAVPVTKSSWVALRHFPQMHTNPVNVIVDSKPIRASRRSALWCVGVIEQLWRVRGPGLPPEERKEAEAVFEKAIKQYRQVAAESPEAS